MSEAEAQETQQKAQLAFTQVTWQRYSRLVAKGVFSRQDGDQTETNYKAQVAVVASAQRNVESFCANRGGGPHPSECMRIMQSF